MKSKKRNDNKMLHGPLISCHCSLLVGRQRENAVVYLFPKDGAITAQIRADDALLEKARVAGKATLLGFGAPVRVEVTGLEKSGNISVTVAPVVKTLATWIINAA